MPIESYTRNVGQVLTAVKRQFGDESGVQITDEDISRWIDDAQLEIVNNNSEVNASLAQINVAEGQTAYPVLENIPDALIIQSVHYDGEYLQGMTFQKAQESIIRKENGQNGKPYFWYERAGVIHLYPKPSASVENGLSLFYSKKPVPITSTTAPLSVPDHYFTVVVQYCLSQAYMLDENAQLSQASSQAFDTGIAQRANRSQSEHNVYPSITDTDDYNGWAGYYAG